MGRRLVLVVLVALAAAETSADAAEPAPGGRYVGDLRGALRCHGCVEVNLANDGGELVDPSGVGDLFDCGSADFVLQSSWAGGLVRPWQSTAVRRGRFRVLSHGAFSAGRQLIRARFVSRRRLEGTIRLFGDPTCGDGRRLRFHARLVGRPNDAPGPWERCERVTTDRSARGYAEMEVWERSVGCTKAREAARRWRSDPACAGLVEGGICSVLGLVCAPVASGERDPGVSARCDGTGQQAVELLRLVPCEDDAERERTVHAIEVDCRTALHVAELWAKAECLYEPTCDVGDWTCRNRVRSSNLSETHRVRCRSEAEPRRGAAIVQHYA